MRPTKAVILAAEPGTPLHPLTDHVPKFLVPIGGRPLLDYWLDLLEESGIHEALINTHARAEQARDYIRRVNARGPVRLIETCEPKPLGYAGTLAANPDFADDCEHVVIIHADNLSDVNLRAMLGFHHAHRDPVTVLLFHAPNPAACAIAELDADYRIVSFIEKPAHPCGDLANAGVYILNPDAYRRIAEMHAFDLDHEVLPQFVSHMRGWVWSGYHLDLGTHNACQRAQADLTLGRFHGPAAPTEGLKPAVFFDRDGTLIEQVHYLSDPRQVKLLPGVPQALLRLRDNGYACVAVTNQSAIGRGKMTENDYAKVTDEMLRQLALDGAKLDAVYHCPLVPRFQDRTIVEHPDRKPGPGMLHRAARDLALSLRTSWMIGDLISDVVTGHNARCRGSILVQTGKGLSETEQALDIPYHTASNLHAAVDRILTEP
jgi:histidinol-phosphate phosphatase family protein